MREDQNHLSIEILGDAHELNGLSPLAISDLSAELSPFHLSPCRLILRDYECGCRVECTVQIYITYLLL